MKHNFSPSLSENFYGQTASLSLLALGFFMQKFYFLFFIFFPFLAFSQSNYVEGYVVKNTGDTLKGYINFRNWTNNPKKISFKLVKNANDIQEFSPGNSIGFSITNIVEYVSYSGELSMNKNMFPNLDETIDTTTIRDTVFLKKIYSTRNVSLLKLVDNLKIRFFYQENTSEPIELKYYQYYSKSYRFSTFKQYTAVLLKLFDKYSNHNEEARSKIQKANFTETSLLMCFKAMEETTTTEKKRPPSTSRFYVGVALNQYEVKYGILPYYSESPPTRSLIPVIHGGIDFFINPEIKRFAFRADFSFQYQNLTLETYRPNPIGENQGEVYRFGHFLSTFSPQIVYNIYNKDTFKFFISSGINLNLSFLKYPGLYSGSERIQNAWVNLPLDAGILVSKHFELYTVYNFPRVLGKGPFSMHMQSFGAGFNYLLGRN